MGNGYSVNGIGNNYANDPAFLYALNSYNPNFMGAQQSQYNQYLQAAQQAAAAQDTTTTTPPAVDPTFKGGSYGSARSSDGPGVGTALAVAGGAAALIYATCRGKGNPIKGGKEIYQSIKKAFSDKAATATEAAATTETVTSKITNLFKNKNAQTEIVHGNTSYHYGDNGQLERIVTRNENVYNKPGTHFTSAKPQVDALRHGAENLSVTGITQTVGGYKVTLDKEGKKIVEILDRSGNKVHDIAKWEKDNAKLAEQAKTFKWGETNGTYWTLENGRLNPHTNARIEIKKLPNGEIEVYADGGKLIGDAREEFLKSDRYKDIITKVGVEPKYTNGGTFSYEYVTDIYGGRIKYDYAHGGTGANVTEVRKMNVLKDTSNTTEISEHFAKTENSGVKAELDKIRSSGVASDGYRIGDTIIVKDNGDTFRFVNGELKGYRIGSAAEVTAQADIDRWLETAANDNRIRTILGS